jgi:tripartite-type tricarboxylate transporter receptor subunit TctC
VAANSVPELIALAKANPGKITLASFGTGSTSHVAGELFQVDRRCQHATLAVPRLSAAGD